MKAKRWQLIRIDEDGNIVKQAETVGRLRNLKEVAQRWIVKHRKRDEAGNIMPLNVSFLIRHTDGIDIAELKSPILGGIMVWHKHFASITDGAFPEFYGVEEPQAVSDETTDNDKPVVIAPNRKSSLESYLASMTEVLCECMRHARHNNLDQLTVFWAWVSLFEGGVSVKDNVSVEKLTTKLLRYRPREPDYFVRGAFSDPELSFQANEPSTIYD